MSVKRIVVHAEIETAQDLIEAGARWLSVAPPFERELYRAYLSAAGEQLNKNESASAPTPANAHTQPAPVPATDAEEKDHAEGNGS